MSNLKIIKEETFEGVVIVGGGVSGCAAAIGAARSGARVLVLESSIALGGMETNGQIAAWNGYLPERCPIGAELDERVRQLAGSGRYAFSLNHEYLKLVLEKMFTELSIEFRYETHLVDALVEGTQVTGIYCSSPEGLILLKAPVFIDATGDGTLAMAAGVPFDVGRQSDHLCQGASLSFQIGGVSPELDILKLPQSFGCEYPVPEGELCQLAREKLTPPAGNVLLHPSSEPGVVVANMTNVVGFDCTSAAERTGAIAQCRRQMEEIVAFLRRYLPGFEQCYLHRSADCFGIRESRHFHGRSVFTEEDIKCRRVFPDWIATRNNFGFDVHSVTGSGLDEQGDLQTEYHDQGYTVPLSACIPENRNGLLLCGRNISGTHLAHSSFRVMPICMNIGQGVGVAASFALKNGGSLDELPIKSIQAELNRQGVFIAG